MNAADAVALLPLIAVGAGTLAVTVAAAVRRSHRMAASLAGVTLAAALLLVPAAWRLAPRRVTPLIAVDAYALFYMALIFAASLVVVLLAHGYLADRDEEQEEFYLFLLLATLGAAVLGASRHFASFFLGLELLSVSLYAMIAYPRAQANPLEAGVKYLVLAAASSSFLLFGMALVYARYGTMEFAAIGAALALPGAGGAAYRLAGFGLILTGVGFKLGVVPFHMWTPDVYEGAPAPVAAFVATVSKGAMFALLVRYVGATWAYESAPAMAVVAVVAVLSMFAGNVLALLQDNVKRILAYSSIAHMGYVLVALLAGAALAAEAVTFYLVAYFVTTLAAFGVVSVLSGPDRDADRIADYRGLFWRRPWVGGLLSAALLSLAGMPLTAGFLGKFYVLAAGVRARIWLPVVVLVVTSALGLFYYLRVIVAVYARGPADPAVPPPEAPALPPAGALALAAVAVLLIAIGVYPTPLLQLIRAAVASLTLAV